MTKKGINVGDKVRIKSKGNEFVGIVLPSAEFLEIKLDNGYNVGFKVENIESIKVLAKGKTPAKPARAKLKQDPSLPLVSIVHTGGTIASRVDYSTGGVSPSFEAEDLLASVPELLSIARVKCMLFSNILSEDADFRFYTELARALRKELLSDSKGIVVTHGTDTMHYTASALSFIFENLPKPILLVGSQRSSDRPSSDAAINLINAARFIAKTDFAGVGICMHASTNDDFCYVLPGTKARKLHSSRRDAFKAVNAKPIAKVSDAGIEYLSDYPKYTGGGLKIYDKFEEKVGILKVRPNMFAEEIYFFEEKKYKGLILEGTGLGHIGITRGKNKENYKAIKSLIDSGCIVCMTTQCIFGETNPNVYVTGRKLKALGVIFLGDMLSETAFVKLAWLLGNFGREKAIELMPRSLRGEISPTRGINLL